MRPNWRHDQRGRRTGPVGPNVPSGILDAMHISQKRGGQIVETPYLANFKYNIPDWTWQQPPEPPKGRPIQEQ